MGKRLKVLFATFALGLLATPALAQTSSLDNAINGYESAAHESYPGLATDWSSNHVVYSNPEPGSDAENAVQQDSRYWMQQIRRIRQASDPSVADEAQAADSVTGLGSDSKNKKKKKKHKKNTLTGLWSVNIGSGATAGNEMYPATFTVPGASAVSCTNDFVAYNTSLAGSGTQASIVAFVNIYSSCTGSPPPTTLWAFDTAAGSVVTSPVISGNGQKLAFVQTEAGVANLVVLTWKAASGTLAAPTVLATNGSYPTCTAPCMITLPLNGNPTDTNSSPFYIFGGPDVLYVGDNKGKLHKFINIFLGGTPSEVTTGGWPVTVGTATTILSSPVSDPNTHNIFVGDSTGNLRYVKDTGSTTGVCSSTSNGGAIPCLGTTNGLASGPTAIALGGAVTDAPLIDVTISKVYWFDSIAGTATTHFIQNAVQTDEALTSATDRTVTFNNGANGVEVGSMHSGAFDNTYYSTPATGFLYVCSLNAGHPNHPSLFRIGFAAGGVMNTTDDGNVLEIGTTSTSPNECSPITEIQTSTTDDFFVGVQANGGLTHCTGACLYSFAIATQTFPAASTAGRASTGGTSGIVLDNLFNAGGSQVYYTPLANSACTTGGTGGCATQASQAGLI